MLRTSLMLKLLRTATLRSAGFLILLAAVFSPVSYANGILWSTGTGNTPGYITDSGGQSVWTEAFIALDGVNHQITITLTNITQDPQDIKYVLGSVQLDLAGLSAGTFSSGLQVDPNGKALTTQVTLDGSGNITNVQNDVVSTWVAQQVGTANTLTLCEICPVSAGTGSPAHMGIGLPKASTGTYSDANNSVTGNSHQPLTLMSGSQPNFTGSGLATPTNVAPTWVLDVPLLNSNTTVTQVRFYYGSLYDTSVASTPTVEIPEPGATSMIAGGFFLIVAGICRRRRTKKQSELS